MLWLEHLILDESFLGLGLKGLKPGECLGSRMGEFKSIFRSVLEPGDCLVNYIYFSHLVP